ncbi:MAG: response regulator [Clostridiales bacterium]|jgi:two-component system response regulator YesN|nr:response regulator [Clostridiales bacterium]
MKLLLVDDEFFIRERVCRGIDWNSLGIAEYREAHDGLEALELMSGYRPDILLTDVRMPKMDGIALAEETVKRYPDCRVIFISGYSDTVCLKKAIALRAVGFVEKPIDMSELASVFTYAREEIFAERDKNSALEQINRLNRIKKEASLAQGLTKLETLESTLSEMPELSDAKRFVTVLARLTGDAAKLDPGVVSDMASSSFREYGAECLCAADSETLIIQLFDTKPILYSCLERGCGRFREYLTRSGADAVFGGGCTVSSLGDLPESYNTALKALDRCYYKRLGCIGAHGDYSAGVYDFKTFNISEFTELLTKDASDHAAFLLRGLICDIKRFDMTPSDCVKRFFYTLTQIIYSAAKKDDMPIFSDFSSDLDIWAHISALPFIDCLGDFVTQRVRRFFEMSRAEATDNAVVNRIIRFVKQNYANMDFGITMISDYMNLSPTYICHLFKDTTGNTLGNYLVNLRMKKAEEMIKDPHYKVKDVARMVGYRNGNYFSYQFKKHMGYSPSGKNESIWNTDD